MHAPCTRWRAIHSFDTQEYGAQYLSLLEGDIVNLASPQADPIDGWSFCELEGDVNCSGWFPADHIALADSTPSLEVSAESLNARLQQLDSDSDTDLSVSSTFMVSSKGIDPKCFLPGTLFIRADGSAAAMQDLRLGDKLKSISDAANEVAVFQKMELHDEAPVLVVQLTAGSPQEFVLSLTADHRLGCCNGLPASHVKLGATIQSSAGPVQIFGKNETPAYIYILYIYIYCICTAFAAWDHPAFLCRKAHILLCELRRFCYQPTYLYMNICLPTCLPTYLLAYIPTCSPACLPTRLPAYLPACLPICLYACLPACILAYPITVRLLQLHFCAAFGPSRCPRWHTGLPAQYNEHTQNITYYPLRRLIWCAQCRRHFFFSQECTFKC